MVSILFFIIASDLQRSFVDKNRRIKYITEERDKLNNLTIENDLHLFGVLSYNFLLWGRPGSGKSTFVNTNYSTLREGYMMIAACSTAQASFTQNITRFPINKNQTFIGEDVYGFSGDNFKGILDLVWSGQLIDGYKQGEPLKAQNLISSPNINDMIHVVVLILDSTDIDKKMIVSEYVEYVKLFQAQGFFFYSMIL